MHSEDDREGYEEDHTDRDDYPEEVWEQMQLEKWETEHGNDKGYPDDVPDPEFTEKERLGNPIRDLEELKSGQDSSQVERGTEEPVEPF
ncbi:MAG TPA: hypothetical protein VGW12_07765 [Pyrinomonadaceae bacterium]|nr:hypothetical protein [Pyrinomonadaceae bacterium]